MLTVCRLLAALGILIILVSCQQVAPDLDSVRIAVSQTPLSSPFFIAHDLNYFEQCGLDAELVPINGGKRAFNKMLSGEVAYATSSDSVASYAVVNESPFNILASFASSENDVKLLSRSVSMPPSTATLGYWGDSASEHLLRTYLALYAPDKKYTLVSYPPEQLVDMFRDGSLDMVSIWEPFAWQIAEGEELEPTYVLDTKSLFSLHFMLLSHPDSSDETSQRLLAALQLAVNQIHQDSELSKETVRNHLSVDAEFIDWIWEDYLFQLKSAISVRYALLSNSYQFNDSVDLDYTQHLSQAYDLPSFTTLIDQWCLPL